jgi:hypothetical protein
MKTTAQKIDGYAEQNTANVLHALRAYFLKAKKSSRAEAEAAAIESYAALCQRRVTGRSVRRWFDVVKSYGGVDKTPSNAFGALRQCPHVKRPIRARLRQISAEVDRVGRELSKQDVADPGSAVEIAFIERDLAACVTRVEHDPIRLHLTSIRRLSRRLANLPIHRLHTFVTVPELETTLTGLLDRLKDVAPKRTERTA